MRKLFLVLALASLPSLSACNRGSRPSRVGLPAQEFTVRDSDRTVSLNQFRGQVVVLNFWATWCAPCLAELPSMIEMQDRLRSRGVTVFGVSIDVDDGAYHRFLKLRSVNFLTVRDPEQKSGRTVRHFRVARNLRDRSRRHHAPQIHRPDQLGFPRRHTISQQALSLWGSPPSAVSSSEVRPHPEYDPVTMRIRAPMLKSKFAK